MDKPQLRALALMLIGAAMTALSIFVWVRGPVDFQVRVGSVGFVLGPLAIVIGVYDFIIQR